MYFFVPSDVAYPSSVWYDDEEDDEEDDDDDGNSLHIATCKIIMNRI